MEAILLKELEAMTQPSAILRRGCTKWASLRLSSAAEAQDSSGYILIAVPDEDCILAFRLDYLRTRLQVKRTKVVFLAIYSIWRLINPFTLKAISKVVYSSLLSALYSSVFSLSEDYPDLPALISLETSIYFAQSPALVFCEFYNCLFAAVDSCTKSKLASEYVRALNKLADTLSNTDWMDNKDLHNRLHVRGDLQPGYEGWMKPLLKSIHAPALDPIPSFPKGLITPYTASAMASPRYFTVSRTATAYSRTYGSSGFPIKDKARRIDPILFNLDPPPPLPPSIIEPEEFHTLVPGPLKPRLRFKRLKHLYLTSPLSKIAVKGKKDSKMLEEVVNKRSKETIKVTSPLDI